MDAAWPATCSLLRHVFYIRGSYVEVNDVREV